MRRLYILLSLVLLLLVLLLFGCGKGGHTDSTEPTTDTETSSDTDSTKPDGTTVPSESGSEGTSQTEGTEPTKPSSEGTSGPAVVLPTEPSDPVSYDKQEPSKTAGWQRLKGSENLWLVSEEAPEGMTAVSMYNLQETILFAAYTTLDDGSSAYRLRIYDPDSRSIVAETVLPCSGSVTLQKNGVLIGVCDSGRGSVWILDHELETLVEYNAVIDLSSWHLTKDMKTVYSFDWASSIYRTDLESGEREIWIEEASNAQVKGYTDREVIFEYYDGNNQQLVYKWLNLETGEQDILPLDMSISRAERGAASGKGGTASLTGSGENAAGYEDSWLLGEFGTGSRYHIITPEKHSMFTWTDGEVHLEASQEYLLIEDSDKRKMSLYNLDGEFLSACELPDAERYIDSELVWSNIWDGYFFLDSSADGTLRLLFWEIQAAGSGEDLALEEYDDTVPGGFSAAPELYKRAEELSEKYHLDIRIADQCQLEYDGFTSNEVNDTETLSLALDRLEEALSCYPDGFFEQLCYGRIKKIQIELVGSLRRTEYPEGGEYTTSGAFAWEKWDHHLMAVDVAQGYIWNYFHEFSHIIDKRLAWDASYRDNALYSEETWLSLQPEGFRYANSYYQISDSVRAYADSGYFVDLYACTYATEDRARVMEMSMYVAPEYFQSRPGLLKKLEYYCQCIRDGFDTTGWPEVTVWERALQK
ncbi:MAG: hypothetical protein J6B85_11100 [Lachnospiraceae bacterium]|nr:hypothetical protein [Lachnospiraceae bacterium]